jgi:hypothetical protein
MVGNKALLNGYRARFEIIEHHRALPVVSFLRQGKVIQLFKSSEIIDRKTICAIKLCRWL